MGTSTEDPLLGGRSVAVHLGAPRGPGPHGVRPVGRLPRAGKSGWGGPDRIAGAERWLPVSVYYLFFLVLD